MNLEKISTTLYDVLGYVLPGFIVIFSLCVFEATFLNSHALFLFRLSKHPVFTVAFSYLVGQITHVAASWLKERFRKLFTDESNRLSPRLQQRVRSELVDFYGISTDEGDLTTLECYQLSEAYNATTGGFMDREIYMAHEGFAKSAMVAITFLAAVLFAAIFAGGAKLQVSPPPDPVLTLHWIITAVCTLACLFVSIAFRKRFLFFNRLKNNYMMLAFLAKRVKNE